MPTPGSLPRHIGSGYADLMSHDPVHDARPEVRYESVDRARVPDLGSSDTGRLSNVIAVTGAGAGKTLLACNLGLALAALGKSVILFDGDLQFGDVGRAFGCGPDSYSTLDLTESSTPGVDLGEKLSNPRDGLWVLPVVSEPSQADRVSTEAFVDGVAEAASLYDVVVVDTAAWWDFHELGTLDVSGLVLFVDAMSTHALQGPKRFYASLFTLRLANPNNVDHCLVLRNEARGVRFLDGGPADLIVSAFERIPAWPVLPEDASVEADHPKSLLVVERAPDSALSRQLVALAEAMVVRLDS
jgi:MinD-like ATPase involved in chromosome partitioning or flagellar assembly